MWTQKSNSCVAPEKFARAMKAACGEEKKPPLPFKHNFRKLVLYSKAKESTIFCWGYYQRMLVTVASGSGFTAHVCMYICISDGYLSMMTIA